MLSVKAAVFLYLLTPVQQEENAASKRSCRKQGPKSSIQ